METNQLPKYDMSDNPTNCCPRFKAEGWDGQGLHSTCPKCAKEYGKNYVVAVAEV